VKIHKFNRDLPDHRSLIKFRNMDKPCMVISADKAKQDAKNFREIAQAFNPQNEYQTRLKGWLNELAEKFEKMEPDND
jgi:hypothetical protein